LPGAVVERVGGLLLGIEYESKASVQATVGVARSSASETSTFAQFCFLDLCHEIPKQVAL
jgi:hypothetical protein